MTSKPQFESGRQSNEHLTPCIPAAADNTGHEIPISSQEVPGLESKMPDPKPLYDEIPTDDGKSQKYKPAGKLKGKNAIITGGDSGIGRAAAVLFAMEGANSFIVYLPEEEEDARETKKRVEQYGQQCHLLAIDLKDKANCKKVVDDAAKVFNGKIDVLFNNAAYQMVVDDINDLSE
jgi:hypothetical protein